MGDRVEHSKLLRGPRRPWLSRKPPDVILAWGMPAAIGHNNGPPIEDEVNDGYVRYKWRRAHAEAWKTPSMSILRFRVARAEAAGVTYEAYMSELLDTGRNSVDPNARKEAYKKALALIAERAYTVPLFSLSTYYATSGDLVFKPYPDEMPRGWSSARPMA